MGIWSYLILFSWQKKLLAAAVRLRRSKPVLYSLLSFPALLILGILALYPSVLIAGVFGIDGLISVFLTLPWAALVGAIAICLVCLTAEWLWQVAGIASIFRLKRDYYVERVAQISEVASD